MTDWCYAYTGVELLLLLDNHVECSLPTYI